MTPAERLRAVADRIERTGADATPAAWWPCGCGCGDVYAGDDRRNKTLIATCRQTEDDAVWVALLSPDTTPALAGLLRTLARIGDKPISLPTVSDTDVDALDFSNLFDNALAFADLILRGDA